MKVGSMNIAFVTTVLVTLFASQLVGTTEQDALVNFQNQNEASTWNAVNDGVMGGRSVGKLKPTTDGVLYFFIFTRRQRISRTRFSSSVFS